MLPKNTTYTFIQAYTFISFQQKVPPIRLFPPILLLFFRGISHLYFYSDSSSIRNSRVDPWKPHRRHRSNSSLDVDTGRVCNMVTGNPRTREKNSWKQAQGGTDLRFWDYRFPEPKPKRSRSHIVFLGNFLCTQTLPFSRVLGFPAIRVWDFSRVSRVFWTLKCSKTKICSTTGMCSITGPMV